MVAAAPPAPPRCAGPAHHAPTFGQGYTDPVVDDTFLHAPGDQQTRSREHTPGRLWVRCALGSFVVLLLSLLALHVLRHDYDFRSRHLSEYAVGPFGSLMTLAFSAAGLGAAALALSLGHTVTSSGPRRFACAALYLAASTNALMAVFVTDLSVPDAAGVLLRTGAGRVHDWLARLHALAWPVAVVTLPLALRVDVRWRHAVPWSMAAGAAVAMALTGRILSSPATVGLTQRLWIATVLVWGVGHALAAARGSASTR